MLTKVGAKWIRYLATLYEESILVVVLNVLRDAYYYPIPFPSIPRLSTLPRSISSLRTYSQS